MVSNRLFWIEKLLRWIYQYYYYYHYCYWDGHIRSKSKWVPWKLPSFFPFSEAISVMGMRRNCWWIRIWNSSTLLIFWLWKLCKLFDLLLIFWVSFLVLYFLLNSAEGNWVQLLMWVWLLLSLGNFLLFWCVIIANFMQLDLTDLFFFTLYFCKLQVFSFSVKRKK